LLKLGMEDFWFPLKLMGYQLDELMYKGDKVDKL